MLSVLRLVWVMAGGLVVIDWIGVSVSFITDLVIAGAESRQRAIKRIFVVVAELYKAIRVFTNFYNDLFSPRVCFHRLGR